MKPFCVVMDPTNANIVSIEAVFSEKCMSGLSVGIGLPDNWRYHGGLTNSDSLKYKGLNEDDDHQATITR